MSWSWFPYTWLTFPNSCILLMWDGIFFLFLDNYLDQLIPPLCILIYHEATPWFSKKNSLAIQVMRVFIFVKVSSTAKVISQSAFSTTLSAKALELSSFNLHHQILHNSLAFFTFSLVWRQTSRIRSLFYIIFWDNHTV